MDIKKGTGEIAAMDKGFKTLSASGKELATQARTIGKQTGNMSQAFLDASTNANKMSISTKAAAVGMKALNIAMNMGLMLAVSAAINLVVTKLGEAKKASEDAASAISGLNDEVKSLDDLKKSMLDMRTELDKGNLSQEDAYNKRLELMKLQDQLITKYGKEAEGIDFVTGSIKEQEDAIDSLARAKENEWKRENQSAINDAKRYLTKTSDGKMTFDDQFNSLKSNDTFDFLKSQVESLGGELKKKMQLIIPPDNFLPKNTHITSSIEFDGTTVDEQIKKYEELFNILEEYKRDSGVNVNSELGEIGDKIKELKNETYTNHKANFDKYTEIEVSSNEAYRNIYAKALKAKEDYNKAIANGDSDNEMSSALSKMQQVEKEFLDAGISDVGVSDYFQKFFDEFKIASKKNQFEVDIKVNKDNLESDVKSALSNLKGLDDIDILHLGDKGNQGTDKQKQAFAKLDAVAQSYGGTVQELIPWLVELGLVQGQASNQTDILSQSLTPLNISLTDITDKTSILATAWKEMDEAGEVTISTIAKMIETDANWADSIEIVNGKITINKNTLVGSARAIITAKKQEALAVIEGCEKQIQALQLSAKAAQQTAEQFVKSSSYISLAAGMAGASGKMYADQMNDLANGKVDGVYDLTKEIAEARKQTEIFDTMLKSLDGDDPFKTIGDSAKKAADEIKKAMSSAQSAINSLLKMTMDMIKQKYTDEKDALQKLKDAEKDRYDASKKALEDAYEQEKKTHDLQKQAIEDAKNGAKAVLDLKLKALQAEKDAYYWSKELAKQNKSVADLEADIASIGNDDSDEGIAKRRELEALLAAEKEKLADMQFDKSIERQEDSLNDEYNLFEETQSNKLDILDKQNQHKEELHQAELERLEKEYNTYIDQQDAKIKAIDEYTKLESNIRAEAIKMIEDKNSDLYRKLLAYNKTYGTGIQQDVTNAWNNAQTSLQHFGGEQFKVLDTLNMLAQKMNDFDLNIKNATNSARDLSNALKQAESIKADLQRSLAEARESLKRAQRVGAGNSVYQGIEDQIRYLENQLGMYHIGGVVTKNGNQKELYPDLKPDEVVAKLKVGETVLSPDDPNRARKLMANFINSDMSLSDFMGDKVKKEPLNIPNITRRYDNTDFSKYQRVSNSSNIDIKQGDIIIQGDAGKQAVMDIKKLTEGVTKELLQQIHRNGHGNLKTM